MASVAAGCGPPGTASRQVSAHTTLLCSLRLVRGCPAFGHGRVRHASPNTAKPSQPSSWRTKAASGQDAAAAPKPVKSAAEVKSDLVKGCKTVMSELQALDFPRNEVRGYFAFVTKLPKGAAKDFDMARTRPVVEQLVAGKIDDITDIDALQVVQLMLSDIWRWRRRGGGMEDETNRSTHAIALEELQNVKPEEPDRISSSLLDNLDISDADKAEMSNSVRQVAMAGINGAVWGSLVACLLFLFVFNFARGM